MPLLHLSHDFLQISSHKQRLRILRHLAAGRVESERVHLLKSALVCMQLTEDLPAGIRHERFKQLRTDRDGLRQVIEHFCQSRLCILRLCKHPRRRLIDIFVASLEQIEDLRDGVRDAQSVHLRLDNLCRVKDRLLQVRVDRRTIHGHALPRDARAISARRHTGMCHYAAEILVRHRDRPLDQIPEGIRKV